MVTGTTVALLGKILLGAAIATGVIGAGGAAVNTAKHNNEAKTLNTLRDDLKQTVNADTDKEFEAYLRDAVNLGYIDAETNKNALNVIEKLRLTGFDTKSLTRKEQKYLHDLYDQLYTASGEFKSLWDKQFIDLDDETKQQLVGALAEANVAIPAPAYLDTSFENYLRPEDPLKLYSSRELADLYNLDFNFENILKDYNNAAQAGIDLASWVSSQQANNAERNNIDNTVSYLDAIRKTKSDAVLNGMNDGARAAAEVLATKNAIQDKVASNQETATARFETMNDALLQKAKAELNATDVYNRLANMTSLASNTLFANDVARLGQDMLSNANYLSADENLRSNMQAQNNLMQSIYNSVAAQNLANSGANNYDWLFKEVYLPNANNNYGEAISNYLGSSYIQNTGYNNVPAKWGGVVNK